MCYPSHKVSKHPLFNIFLLFCTVDEVCNVSNKYRCIYFLRHSKKVKSRRSEKWNNASNRNNEPSNLLTVDFRPLGNRVFDFSTNLRATIMLQKMRYFVNKNSNSLLNIRDIVNNIQQVKTFTGMTVCSCPTTYAFQS